MYKPVADIMRDEAGNPEVMQHALTFDYIPVIKPKYNQRNMEHGGVIHFGETPTDEEEEDADLTLDTLAERVQELEDKQKPNINQPVGDGGPGDVGPGGTGSEGAGPSQGAAPSTGGVGTFGSMMSGIADLPGQLGIGKFGFTPIGILGSIFSGIASHEQQETETDTAVAAGRGTTDSEGNTTSTTTMGTEADTVDITGHDPSITGLKGVLGDYMGIDKHSRSDKDIQEDYKSALDDVESEEAQAEHSTSGIGTSSSTGDNSGDTDGDGDTGVEGGGASGGLIKGYQEGAMVEEQADTTMDTAGLGPMGLVDDMDGDQVTGVEDDLDMETEEGAYVLNADAVELVGLKDLNQLVKDAIDIAIESDIPLPKVVDPTKKVPIKISNGEYVIPAILVPIIGLENLEKMNKRGLEYREKNREEAPPQEAQEQDVPVEPSEVPSRGVPGEINLAQGGALADQMDRLM